MLRKFCTLKQSIKKYNHKDIEKYWQNKWKQRKIKEATSLNEGQEKSYILSMFPYPSGNLHMGHVRVYTISDCIAQYQRMCGKKVLHPMGWDSFGLPAENAAIDHNINPMEWTTQNIKHMRSQLHNLGVHFDWSQEVSTCDPKYYCWTQWLFLQLYKHDLVYQKKSLVNWDPVDCTVLANEQVDEQGCSWRSGAKVEQRYLNQWYIKITDYAERLLQGIDDLDWPKNVKQMQHNWIGKSQGVFFEFQVRDNGNSLKVFTTRPDTIYGVTFLAISPEHSLLSDIEFSDQIMNKVQNLLNTSCCHGNRTKVGVNLNLMAKHPLTGDEIPVYVADYVVSNYGSQAIMGVPAHDERDYEFAINNDIPVKEVLTDREGKMVLINSSQFTGLNVKKAQNGIIQLIKSLGIGGHMTQYKLRDWLISRQRYWGTPIPIIYCDKCGVIPVSESDLPVILPTNTELSGRGVSLLLRDKEWLNVKCNRPDCTAQREPDTMDTFIDSSWYFLRFIDPNNTNSMVSHLLAQQWMPVDIYVGGVEHAILHLLYARFISHFLYDIGIINHKEPFRKLLTQGMVQGKTYRTLSSGRYLKPEEINNHPKHDLEVKWEKMSKSKYNGIDPEVYVTEYGGDTIRLFTLFKAPPEVAIQWDIKAIKGVYKWLWRVWTLVQEHIKDTPNHSINKSDELLLSATSKTIKQVTVSLEKKHTFNVAVAEMMSLSNVLKGVSNSMSGSKQYHNSLLVLCKLLTPFAPHISAELWEDLRIASNKLEIYQNEGDVSEQEWLKWTEWEEPVSNQVELVIQVNGRKRMQISIEKGLSKEKTKEIAKRALAKQMELNTSDIIIAPHGRLVNIVTN